MKIKIVDNCRFFLRPLVVVVAVVRAVVIVLSVLLPRLLLFFLLFFLLFLLLLLAMPHATNRILIAMHSPESCSTPN